MTTTLEVRIKEARKRAGLTQAELASALGVSTQTMHRWEAGKASIPADRLVELAQVTGVRMDFLTPSVRQETSHGFSELEDAKKGKLLNWWGDVAITFEGQAPSIVRALSGNAVDSFYRYCLPHNHFFSFIDMSGRFLLVNRALVKRLMLLDEADGRNPVDLLDPRFDAAPSHPLAELYGHNASEFMTTLEEDRALQLLADLSLDGEMLFTKEAFLLAVEEDETKSEIAQAVAEVGMQPLLNIIELLSKVDDPDETLQRVGGPLVDVHLIDGLTRTVQIRKGFFESLFTAGDDLEDQINMGEFPQLWTEDEAEGLLEIFPWKNIAWIEASALHLQQAFAREFF